MSTGKLKKFEICKGRLKNLITSGSLVFWCFQGMQNKKIEQKWVNRVLKKNLFLNCNCNCNLRYLFFQFVVIPFFCFS